MRYVLYNPKGKRGIFWSDLDGYVRDLRQATVFEIEDGCPESIPLGQYLTIEQAINQVGLNFEIEIRELRKQAKEIIRDLAEHFAPCEPYVL